MSETDTNRDDLIRARAHRIWENEGCPDGQDAEHWARAKAELEAEDASAGAPSDGASDAASGAPSKATKPKAPAKPRKKPVPKANERDMAPELSEGHTRAEEEGNVPPNTAGPKGRKRNTA